MGFAAKFTIEQHPVRWAFYAVIAALVILFVTVREGIVRQAFGQAIPSPKAQNRFALILIAMPLLAWAIGKQSAEAISTGREYSQVTLSNPVVPTYATKLRFLGATTTHAIFLLDNGPRVWVVRNDAIPEYVLRRVKR